LEYFRWKQLQGDFIAGLTVGLTVIPQGLAYAKVAGLSPEVSVPPSLLVCLRRCICLFVCHTDLLLSDRHRCVGLSWRMSEIVTLKRMRLGRI